MRSLFALVVVLALAPAEAAAQPASTPPPPLPSRLWLTAGAASATLHGDCQTCETDYPYRHDGSVLVNAGYRVNHRMDVGARGVLGADGHRPGHHPHDAFRRGGAVPALGVAGVLHERRRRDGVRPQLGRHHQQRVAQLESAVGAHRHRLGVQATPAIRLSDIRQPARRRTRRPAHGRRRHPGRRGELLVGWGQRDRHSLEHRG